MRVLTWNLWWRFGPWEERQPAIAAVLAAEAPDVACLQEVWAEEGGRHQAQLLAEGLGYHWAAGEVPFVDGMAFVNAVVSRWPVLEADTLPLPGDDGSAGPRHALWVQLDRPGGPVPVVCTHLDWSFDASATRLRQVAEVARLVAGRRPDPSTGPAVVLCGDLNATPESDEVRALTGRSAPPVPGLVFQDAWEVAGDGTPGHTWDDRNPHLADAAWPRRRLDYVLVSWPRPKPVGTPRRCWLAGVEPVGGVQASDHYAVVAELV